MAGRGTLSVNQSKAYGDQKALDAMKAQTTTPMTGVPIPAQGAGRPPGGAATAQPPPQQPRQSDVPLEHRDLMTRFATAARVKQYWDTVAAQYPSSWSRMYAADADEEYQRLGHELRGKTPFFNL